MKKFHRSVALSLVLMLLLTLLPLAAAADEVEGTKFTVLSTTDVHGKIWDTNLLNGTKVNNSLLNVATAVKEIREAYGDNVILIDNGDLYQGTPVSSYQISQYTLGNTTDPNPMSLALEYIGYDTYTLGNHEFNYAWSTMTSIYDYLANAGISCVCANLYFEATGERVFTPYITTELTLEGQTFTVAIIGIENTDCTRWDVPDNYPGIRFSSPENDSLDVAYEVQKVQNEMAEAGVNPDFTILAYHAGLGSYTGDELIYGTNTDNQGLRTVTKTTGIDMVILGHDHSSSYSNTIHQNADGEDVLVVNAGGTSLTQSVFTATYTDGKFSVTLDSSENLNLGDYAIDEDLKALVAPYAEAANDYVTTSVGELVGDWDGYNGNLYLTQSDTIDLVNRAQIWAGTNYLNQKYDSVDALNAKLAEIYGEGVKVLSGDTLEVDISSTSVVTSGPAEAGDLSMKGIYTFYKYDNSLYLLALTGQEILDLMEWNAVERLAVKVDNGTANYKTINDGYTNPVFYGLEFTYDMAQEPGSRVKITGLSNGKEFNVDDVYIFAINNYHLGNSSSSELVKYTTEQAIWSQTDDLGGGYAQDMIAEYVTAMTETYGGVYSTAQADKNGEPICHWGFEFSGDASQVTLPDTIIASGDKVTELTDGMQVVFYYGSSFETMGTTGSLDGVEAYMMNDVLYADAGTAIFTVSVTDNGVLFQTEQGYLCSGGSGSLAFVDTVDDTCYWTAIPTADGGFNLKNNAYDNIYMEYWKRFTTYTGENEANLGNEYAMTLYTAGAYEAPVVDNTEAPTTGEDTTPADDTTPAEESGNSTVVIIGIVALVIVILLVVLIARKDKKKYQK